MLTCISFWERKVKRRSTHLRKDEFRVKFPFRLGCRLLLRGSYTWETGLCLGSLSRAVIDLNQTEDFEALSPHQISSFTESKWLVSQPQALHSQLCHICYRSTGSHRGLPNLHQMVNLHSITILVPTFILLELLSKNHG